MNRKTASCLDSRLEVLLSGDEGSQFYAQSSDHVESCPACQQRLTELAGDQQTWRHVGKLLGDYPADAMVHLTENVGTQSPDSPVGSPADTLAALEGVLDAPSHPEMLGRLGRYEIERVIGTGGMGIVLRGFDTDLNRPVAIKILASHLAHSGAARQRFARESRAAAAVVNEHVVAIHNVEARGKTPFLVMQYVAGESLQARVDRIGPLDAREVLRIGIQAAAGLHAAHQQGVIHRDIKPANILLEHGVDRALVTDFGLARTVDDASLTHTGIVAGTPHYMSPEQAGGQPADLRTDLFSLGAVLYFMATGRPPFRAERAMGVLNRICHEQHKPAWQVNPDVPDELSDIIDRLLEKKATRRPATAADAQSALTHCLASIQHRSPTLRRQLSRWWRRNRSAGLITAWVSAAAVGMLMLMPLLPDKDASTERSRDSARAASTRQAPAEPAFSVETWWQATSDESQRWNQSLQQLDQRLGQLQASWSHTNDDAAPRWEAQVSAVHSQLNQLQSDVFATPSSSH